MKLFILLLALATVSYATTHGLKAHLGLKNRIHQDNEEALLTGASFSVLPEDLAVEQEPVVEQAVIEQEPQVYYSAPYVDDEEAYIAPNTDIAYTTSTYQEIAPVQEEYVIEIEAAPEAPIAVPISIPGAITGGWTDIDPSAVDNDADLRALVELGVSTSLDVGLKDGKIPAGIQYHLSNVSSIKSQVVAGTNYQISVELTDGGDRRIFADFTIFDQPWSQTREVTHLCIRVGRYVSI